VQPLLKQGSVYGIVRRGKVITWCDQGLLCGGSMMGRLTKVVADIVSDAIAR